MRFHRTPALLAALAASACALAQEGAPPVRDYQGIRYVTGGVTTDEREQLSSIAGDYNLRLAFAEKGGDYLADVGVVVTRSDGRKVLELTTDGPLVLAKLPAGDYKIKASAAGKDQERTANVPASGQRRLMFYW